MPGARQGLREYVLNTQRVIRVAECQIEVICRSHGEGSSEGDHLGLCPSIGEETSVEMEHSLEVGKEKYGEINLPYFSC